MRLYMKQSPDVHLRITRTDAQRLFSLPDPQADVFIYPHDPLRPACDWSHILFIPESGETLVCAVHPAARAESEASALLSLLYSHSKPTNPPQSLSP